MAWARRWRPAVKRARCYTQVGRQVGPASRAGRPGLGEESGLHLSVPPSPQGDGLSPPQRREGPHSH